MVDAITYAYTILKAYIEDRPIQRFENGKWEDAEILDMNIPIVLFPGIYRIKNNKAC